MVLFPVTVGDKSKGNVDSVVENENSIILPFPCINTTDCTHYSVSLPAGKFVLEVWGAQGGNDSFFPETTFGGRGGYSKGTLILQKPKTLYVYVGGSGTGDTRSTWGSSGGGGSTDIRLSSGLWNSNEGLFSRILVSGGGGGRHGKQYESKSSYIGNDGGGSTAPTFTVPFDGSVVTVTGGSSTSGGSSNCTSLNTIVSGSFGYASPNSYSNSYSLGGYNGGSRGSDNYANGGAGGGWWGGCTSWPVSSGGSGFVLNASTNPQNYHVSSDFFLSKGETISGNEAFLDPFGKLETGHHGNGAAKITIQIYFKNQICSCFHSTFSSFPLSILGSLLIS